MPHGPVFIQHGCGHTGFGKPVARDLVRALPVRFVRRVQRSYCTGSCAPAWSKAHGLTGKFNGAMKSAPFMPKRAIIASIMSAAQTRGSSVLTSPLAMVCGTQPDFTGHHHAACCQYRTCRRQMHRRWVNASRRPRRTCQAGCARAAAPPHGKCPGCHKRAEASGRVPSHARCERFFVRPRRARTQ